VKVDSKYQLICTSDAFRGEKVQIKKHFLRCIATAKAIAKWTRLSSKVDTAFQQRNCRLSSKVDTAFQQNFSRNRQYWIGENGL
jgi:hypothetical protein